MSNPVAVLISDIHYNLQTIELANASMIQAIYKANELRIPLVVAGDLHDTKANLRGECVEAMIETFKLCNSPPYILVGNHDKINEKSDKHSLEFLRPFAAIVDYLPGSALHKIGYLIPYQHDIEVLRSYLKKLPKGSRLIMHQGLENSNSGEYYQDKTALKHEDITDFRVISGHYHYRQDIKTGRPQKGAVGVFSYIGNPYTLNFGEADDPEKGFQILMDDGILQFVLTNIRKHIVIESTVSDLVAVPYLHKQGDLLWFKCEGTKEELLQVTKQLIADNYGVKDNFKLDLILIGADIQATKKDMSNQDLMDSLIDSTNNSSESKTRLKSLWRSLDENSK